MNSTPPSEPLVTVLTPVYNGEEFLVECIESVLKQSYRNFEYIIVNNRSTDRTLEIAQAYAQKDPRIRIHNNAEHVPVIANHNIAFRQISPHSKYCKVVSADDWIFPDCLQAMVAFGEAHPTAGFIGCYQLSGAGIRWQGFAYPKALFSGREVCLRVFHDEPEFGLGSPTSLLYRADVVRSQTEFYPNPSPHSDTSAIIANLTKCDYGFVYQVLSFERLHQQTQSHTSNQINRYTPARLNDITHYGRLYLDEQEYQAVLKATLDFYYFYLGTNVFRFRGKKFWDYHKNSLTSLGYSFSALRVARAETARRVAQLLNPDHSIRKLIKRIRSKGVNNCGGTAGQPHR